MISSTINSYKSTCLESKLKESLNLNKSDKIDNINIDKQVEDRNELDLVNQDTKSEYREILDSLLKKYYDNKDTLWLNCKIIKDATPDTYNLYIKYQNQLCEVGLAYIPNMATSKFLNKLFLNSSDNYIISCSYDHNFNKWKPTIKKTREELKILSISNLETYLV